MRCQYISSMSCNTAKHCVNTLKSPNTTGIQSVTALLLLWLFTTPVLFIMSNMIAAMAHQYASGQKTTAVASAVNTARTVPFTEAANLKTIDAQLPPSGFTSSSNKPITEFGPPTTIADNRTAHRKPMVNMTANDSTGSAEMGGKPQSEMNTSVRFTDRMPSSAASQSASEGVIYHQHKGGHMTTNMMLCLAALAVGALLLLKK